MQIAVAIQSQTEEATITKETVHRLNKNLEPASSGVLSTEATKAPMLGWLVKPDIESTATSTMSAPASAAANIAATPAPAVSWVWTCIGMLGYFSLRAVTKILAAFGFSKPAMSYKPQYTQ